MVNITGLSEEQANKILGLLEPSPQVINPNTMKVVTNLQAMLQSKTDEAARFGRWYTDSQNRVRELQRENDSLSQQLIDVHRQRNGPSRQAAESMAQILRDLRERNPAMSSKFMKRIDDALSGWLNS